MKDLSDYSARELAEEIRKDPSTGYFIEMHCDNVALADFDRDGKYGHVKGQSNMAEELADTRSFSADSGQRSKLSDYTSSMASALQGGIVNNGYKADDTFVVGAPVTLTESQKTEDWVKDLGPKGLTDRVLGRTNYEQITVDHKKARYKTLGEALDNAGGKDDEIAYVLGYGFGNARHIMRGEFGSRTTGKPAIVGVVGDLSDEMSWSHQKLANNPEAHVEFTEALFPEEEYPVVGGKLIPQAKNPESIDSNAVTSWDNVPRTFKSARDSTEIPEDFPEEWDLIE